MELLNLSHREKSNGARAREREGGRERGVKGEGGGLGERGAGEESERCPNTMAHNQ